MNKVTLFIAAMAGTLLISSYASYAGWGMGQPRVSRKESVREGSNRRSSTYFVHTSGGRSYSSYGGK
jgi:hypothetical protein